MNNSPTSNLKLAERGAILSIVVYIVLSVAKISIGNLLDSSSLTADGFNNVSDIVANIAVLIGLRMARKPADTDHKFGHWKIEDLASLITSFIMFYVGFDVLIDTIQKIMTNQKTIIDPLGAFVGLISAFIMVVVYAYNKRLAKKVHSKALDAAAKDNLSDAVTSLGTTIAILASALNFPIVDKIVAVIITFFILKTAYEIFMESSFSLSDGFDENLLKDYEKAILELPKITKVKSQRGRTYGSNIYLDIILEMNPDLSVYESHEVTEQVEQLLKDKFDVFDIDIHVEPAIIDEDEIFENIYNKLYRYELEMIQGQGNTDYFSPEICYLTMNGEEKSFEELLESNFSSTSPSAVVSNFSVMQISQKTMLVRYQLNHVLYANIWRRHETWQLIFHQESKITES
ncbi:cation diffusion facilitator family transporter [Streptococcus massiliensis]|uniref:Cation efflux family protein n=1 Tax=Streptococcus massiliensis TaxID=313439 RepID=A0A380KW52_9STRE|nr:cation diffusion facilitator family transporter [Streptococcus massiliensis]SUN75915.1 cation efflux family protein [Streptococcus massiliensis]